MIELIVDNTNLYAAQQGFPVTFTRDNILGFLGMNIAMGIVGFPEVKDYWAREPMLQHPWFPTVMPRDKFLAISRFLHFADNTQAPSGDDSDHDRLWKIRPVIEVVKEQSSKAYVLGKKVSIDESMIGTKCRLGFIQYMPKKPTKWGVKVWVFAEAKTGYIYNFEVYTGKHDVPENGLAYGVVFRLLNDLLESGRVLYCDNFYTSPHLFEDLYEHGIFASGTVRTNRKEFPSSLVQHRLARSESKFFYHGALTAGKWVDKRDVYFLSTLHRDEMEDVIRHGPGGVSETISKPKIVTDYNKFMSGVDIADQYMVYYACGRKSMKWYKRVFWRLVEHAILYAFVLFSQVTGSQYRQKNLEWS